LILNFSIASFKRIVTLTITVSNKATKEKIWEQSPAQPPEANGYLGGKSPALRHFYKLFFLNII